MNKVIIVLILVLGTIYLSPLVSNYIPNELIVLLLLSTLCLFFIKKSKHIIHNIRPINLTILLITVMLFLYKCLEVSSCEWGNIYNQISFLLSIYYFLFIEKELTYRQKRFLVIYFFTLTLYLIGDNIRLYSIYGLAELNSDIEYELIETNYGGTTFNTVCFVFFTSCYFVFLNTKEKIKKILSICACLFSFYYIFYCGARGTVVILTLFVITILPLIKKLEKNKRAKPILLSISLLFLLLLLIDYTFILDFFISISPERLAKRFIDIRTTTQEGLSEDSFSGRYALYGVSLNSFLNGFDTFLFGIGDHRGSVSGLFTYQEAGVGGHSEILDTCARFGLLGIVLFSCYFKLAFKKFYSLFKDSVRKEQVKYIIIGLVMCFFVKSILHPNIGFAIFVFLPLSFMLINKKNTL